MIGTRLSTGRLCTISINKLLNLSLRERLRQFEKNFKAAAPEHCLQVI